MIRLFQFLEFSLTTSAGVADDATMLVCIVAMLWWSAGEFIVG